MPTKVERCVESLLNRKTFKPKADKKDRESSAWAICQASLKKTKNEFVVEMLGELPLDVDISLSEEGSIQLSEIEDYQFEDDIEEVDEDAADSRICTAPKKEGEEPSTFCTFSEVSLASKKEKEDDSEEEELLELEVLREGKFEHPWYGPLDFNRKFFLSMVENFLNNTMQREISFDSTHRPTEGATAWVKKFGIKRRKFNGQKIKNILTAGVELTDWGRKLIEGKQFKYFSSEVEHNYIDAETGKEFGPTAVGGGLTNRPFITGMLAVQMSEDAPVPSDAVGTAEPGVITMSEEADNGQDNSDQEAGNKPQSDDTSTYENTIIKAAAKDKQQRPPESKLPDSALTSMKTEDGNKKPALPHHGQQVNRATENSEVKVSTDEGANNMEKLQEKIAELEGRIASLDEKDKNSDLAVALQDQLDFLNIQMEAIPAKLEEVKQKVATELQSKFDDQSKKLETLETQVQTFEDERQQRDIKDRCEALVKDGHYPVVANKLRDMALSMDKTTVVLSEDGKDTEMSFVEAVTLVLSVLPPEARVDESESLGSGNDDNDDIPENEDKSSVLQFGDTKIDLLSQERIDGLVKRVSGKPVN